MEPQKKYPNLLKKELEEELLKIDKEISLLELKIANINSRYAVLKKQSETRSLSDWDKQSMAGCWEDSGRFTAEINKLEKRKVQITQQKESVINRDADKLYEEARNIGQTTGKNKLYIGSRQFVALHPDSKKTKAGAEAARRRILNANNWTWGVNFAWIEGGTTAAARIKIKENEENPNDYETIPEGAYEIMLVHPRMSGKDWLALCQKFPNTILWHGQANRPTWTALEIEACLNAGYRFNFREHKHRDGRVIELVPR